jgi:menaquinone-specific isochorismate synthase
MKTTAADAFSPVLAGISNGSRPPHQEAWNGKKQPDTDSPRIVTLFTAAPKMEALPFLRESRGVERFFWSEPANNGNPLVIAGSGIAAEVIVPPALRGEQGLGAENLNSRYSWVTQQTSKLFIGVLIEEVDFSGINRLDGHSEMYQLLRPRLFGGFAFQEEFTPDNTWSVFNPAHFILPHYLLIQLGDLRYLAINAVVSVEDDPVTTIDALKEALAARLAQHQEKVSETPAPAKPDWVYPMTPSTWHELIEAAKKEMVTGQLQKVVLARVCEIRFEDAVDIVSVLGFLDQNYGDCYRFLFEPVPNHAFFGATPELLIKKEGTHIETMALAGSAARGRTKSEDGELVQDLLASLKERHEHQLVVDEIITQLRHLTDKLEFPDQPETLRLKNIHHLQTPIRGILKKGRSINVIDLVQRLHPTPALGGVPADRSMDFLQRVEPVTRGWYAGPIGWIDNQLDGVFAVGIRSAVTQHERVWLYAGAGIIQASEADREWEETKLKFKPILESLGVNESAT